ncbi:IS30 family transposase, partial [Paraburkholderia azotifigens]|uniref:IS30 family transposase n=1 Tax=Paraburkholderia azotifigens TaxID=2057004 RepID=UPI0031796983
MNKNKYQQLQPEERITIASMKQQGLSVRAMARTLGRPTSTVSRELTRNTCPVRGYASVLAQGISSTRRAAARPPRKLDHQGALSRIVLSLLSWKWSPQQISGTLKRIWPEDPSMHVSHETIYTAIYAQPRGELRRQLIACLRHGHNTRMSRKRGTDRRGQIPDMVSIHVRPPEVDDRLMPGHWEGDFIKGAGNQSSVGVLVERTSRLVLLAKMEDATAASALAGFTAKLNSIAAPLRQSFTYDQGKEMTRHQELSAATGVRVYFCDPHSPWQRGTCENTNGLLRQYLPKGTDLSIYTQIELDAIADSLNSRPRA